MTIYVLKSWVNPKRDEPHWINAGVTLSKKEADDWVSPNGESNMDRDYEEFKYEAKD